MSTRLTVLPTVLLAAAFFNGCIPSGPPPEPEATPAEQAANAGVVLVDQNAPAAPPAQPSEGEDGLNSSLALEDMPRVNAAIQVITRPESPGFPVRGTLNPNQQEPQLIGTIVPGDAAPDARKTTWTFSATYTAPTGGYALGKPFLSRTFGRNVILSLPVELPGKDAMVTQAQEQHTVSLLFEAQPDANFIVQWFQARDIGTSVASPEEVGQRPPE